MFISGEILPSRFCVGVLDPPTNLRFKLKESCIISFWWGTHKLV